MVASQKDSTNLERSRLAPLRKVLITNRTTHISVSKMKQTLSPEWRALNTSTTAPQNRTMASLAKEKGPLVTEIPLGAASGDVTPTTLSPSTEDVTSEADKKLEAMGYAPVSKIRRHLSDLFTPTDKTSGLQARVLHLVQLQLRHEHLRGLRLAHVDVDIRASSWRRRCHHVELGNRRCWCLGDGHQPRRAVVSVPQCWCHVFRLAVSCSPRPSPHFVLDVW